MKLSTAKLKIIRQRIGLDENDNSEDEELYIDAIEDAIAEIKWLNKTLAAAQELVDVSVEQMTHEANKAAALQEKNEQLRAALQCVLDADALIGDVDMSMKPEHIRTEKAQRIANFILAKEHARRVLGEVTG